MEEIKKRGRPKGSKDSKPRNPPVQYRDENGVRKQTYRRYKENVDYLPLEPNEMSAMIGLIQNKGRIGRPPIFESVEELQGAIQAFWDYIREANEKGNYLIPDVEGLCCYLDINRDTLNEWERSNYRNFSATVKSTKNSIVFCKKQLALRGKIPPIVFATDFNNNHGYTQKQEMVLTPNNPLGDSPDRQTIAAKYAELPDK